MEIGSDEWARRAVELAKDGLCSYCGEHPIYREFPSVGGICLVCDGKLAKPSNGCTNDKCVHYHEYAPIVARQIVNSCEHAGWTFKSRNWHTHHLKMPLEQMVIMMLDEMAGDVVAWCCPLQLGNNEVETRTDEARFKFEYCEGCDRGDKGSCDGPIGLVRRG